MQQLQKWLSLAMSLTIVLVSFTSCEKDNDGADITPDLMATYFLQDQTARPAINTVFNTSDATKNQFNVTVPGDQGSMFATAFKNRLMALNPGYTTNALGLDAATFTNVLATDVLNVSTTGTTTFFDGTNVLTGRNLTDDVISVELLLIFGGPDGTANPTLTDDHVDANDKAYLSTFPYLATPH
ncbi:MAG: DUF4331 family protein [Lewinellaceae bacterium]|nr:DUF4331 family protein [Lewinellaceae bacterium]